MSNELAELKQANAEIMAIISNDTPLTHKIKALIEQPNIKKEFLALIPEVVNQEQILKAEIQSMIFDIMQSTELQQCTPQSFLFCLKDSLARGLRIGSTYKEAWLVKFSNKKGANWVNEAKVMVGYRAYINRAWNENKMRFSVGTITKDEMQYVTKWDKQRGQLEINIPLGKESKLHTRDNIEYVYVTAIFEDGSTWSDLYTKEAMEEKSKVGKWQGSGDNKVKVFELGAVWQSKDRKTDYKEMLHKAAIIQFSKLLPQRSLSELADFDHTQIETMQDVTPDPTHADLLNAEFLKTSSALSSPQHNLQAGDVTGEGGAAADERATSSVPKEEGELTLLSEWPDKTVASRKAKGQEVLRRLGMGLDKGAVLAEAGEGFLDQLGKDGNGKLKSEILEA